MLYIFSSFFYYVFCFFPNQKGLLLKIKSKIFFVSFLFVFFFVNLYMIYLFIYDRSILYCCYFMVMVSLSGME
jgi:hypothetical protein